MRITTSIVAIAVTTSLAGAQVVVRRPDVPPPSTQPTNFVGGDVMYAQPQREFGDYVNGAFGLGGHYLHAFDADGIFALRIDGGFLVYGSTTNRQALGGGALGLISVDVTTSNNIAYGAIGMQLMAPTGKFRPYAHAGVGVSYFFTESSVEGSSGAQAPFANSQNFSDGGYTLIYGGGVYIPVGHTPSGVPISLDIGATAHGNKDIQYLTKNSISISNSSSPPVITPVRSAADFVTFKLGLTFALR